MKPIQAKNSQNFHQLPIENYDSLLAEKTAHLKHLLAPYTSEETLATMAVHSSPISHFRMRAEFGIWHEKVEDDQQGDCFYTMMEKDSDGNKQKVILDDSNDAFPIASKAINELMPKLLAKIKANELLKQRLFQVEFLNTLNGDMLVTLIYHKKLTDDWQALANELERQLHCYIIGRSRKQKIVVSQDFVIEKLKIVDKLYTYQQLEGSFTQPNADICQQMLTWACKQAQVVQAESLKTSLLQNQVHNQCQNDLLELYCGNANFTLPLSQYFDKTLATEISKTSVASAKWNIERNKKVAGVANIAIARLSAEEFTEAKTGKRTFRRLQQAGIELADYQFSTVFVDPPRAGIDDDTLKLLSEFDNIIYISCNPETLADNLKTLSNSHQVTATALFDQFPYTHHIESGVLLQKR